MHAQISVRRASALVALLLLACMRLHAQGGGEQFNFDDIPVDDARQYYVALGGGYLGMMAFPKYDEFNNVASGLNLDNFSGPVTMHGGGAFVSLFFVQHLRLGVFGLSGSKIVQKTEADSSTRSLRFSASITGAQLDYAVRVTNSFTLLPGIMFGPETYRLEMTQAGPGGPTFGSLFSSSQGSGDHNARISNTHAFYYPAVNLEYAFTQFFMLRLGAGYKGSFAYSDWTNDNDVVVKNVPEIRSDGFGLQFGVFFGFFQSR
ncbi:MAG TPA: hypothetical protein VHI13_21785 [Candidatus Kapabacteria bacterium]|nr:hypothetical protein [Candidatus Kapabacteria bacterium]